MIIVTRGRGSANGKGNSFANSDALPAFLRLNREYLMAWQAQYSFWTEMA